MSLLEFVDTHCHIHEASGETGGDEFVRDKWTKGGFTNPGQLVREAREAGVKNLICVGCTLKDSQMAIELAAKETDCWASIGIHPHEAKDHLGEKTQNTFAGLIKEKKVIAVGEIGLDYFYTHSSKADQFKILEFQLDLAQKHHLPVVFHVRDAFADFWPVFDNFRGITGVIHSFSASSRSDLEQILTRGLYVGLNGIMTFTKDTDQLEAAKAIPLQKLLLETDAPFLTPAPFRGKICEPKHVVVTAEFLSHLRGEPLEELAAATTKNAKELFRI